MKQGWLIVCVLLALAVCGCSPNNCNDDPACVGVLFIGNSYTFVNDLPNTLVKLAQSAGNRLEIGMAAQGGWMLSDHLKSAETLNMLKTSRWSFVVLQEQSMLPANEAARNTQMYPAARELASRIKAAGAKPILFVTWAHKDGWPENGNPNYESMQFAIDDGYMRLGQQLPATLAPVGYAWLALHQQNPQLNLWQEDGSHPNQLGTYLAACIFYTVIYHKSPEGLNYQGNLSSENAKLLQNIAAETVLTDEKKWNLP